MSELGTEKAWKGSEERGCWILRHNKDHSGRLIKMFRPPDPSKGNMLEGKEKKTRKKTWAPLRKWSRWLNGDCYAPDGDRPSANGLLVIHFPEWWRSEPSESVFRLLQTPPAFTPLVPVWVYFETSFYLKDHQNGELCAARRSEAAQVLKWLWLRSATAEVPGIRHRINWKVENWPNGEEAQNRGPGEMLMCWCTFPFACSLRQGYIIGASFFWVPSKMPGTKRCICMFVDGMFVME